MDECFLASLQCVKGLGNAQLKHLLENFSSSKEIWFAGKGELLERGRLPEGTVEALLAFREKEPDHPKNLEEQCEKKGIKICSVFSKEYPKLLKEIYQPPVVLFYRGTLPREEDFCLAMVGSRKFTRYGERIALDFSESLAAAGITIVSGAARGIDTCAHLGAMKKGKTIAVLGCGVDVAYPKENKSLLSRLSEQGAVISEYAPGTPPFPAFFPARNRIISGLCRGTVVVEAAKRSGSLITAELALNEGRDVFAVPGPIFSESSEGCNRLIQQGARLVTSAEDILKEYGRDGMGEEPVKETLAEMTPEEAEIYHVLSYDHPLSVDEIIYSLKGSRDAAGIAFQLLQMELKGLISENKSHAYLRAGRK